MKIGIIADSHDNIPALKKAVNLFNEMEVACVIHAADLIAPFVSKPLSRLHSDFVAVFGNNEGEKFCLRKTLQNKIYRAFYILQYKGKTILMLH
ncbi:MAG: metallophosphoesterase family protein [bacterium]